MNLGAALASESLGYQTGLDRLQESVISSHFMHRMAADPRLHLYDDLNFRARVISIDRATVIERMLPLLLDESARYCETRAETARARARQNYRDYGYTSESQVGLPEQITEALLDKEFSRSAARYIEKQALNRNIKRTIAQGDPLNLVIPALPFKISSPLKSRGSSPDLGEVGFLLSLYEITRTVHLLRAEAHPAPEGALATFTVVADGHRFHEAVNKPSNEIAAYQHDLESWIKVLGLGSHLRIVDYRELLQAGLPPDVYAAKQRLRDEVAKLYDEVLWQIFDVNDMEGTLRRATAAEPDPEYDNPDGRFVSLLKSLVYSVNYRALADMKHADPDSRARLYRELTSHLFEPYAATAAGHAAGPPTANTSDALGGGGDAFKERLRRHMLHEVWAATVAYMAEIRSDRDLPEDPILSCLPGHYRWTIHAKRGQIAIASPPIGGIHAQAWAGSAVFRLTSKGKVRLCTLPRLLLEATGAIPVIIDPGLPEETSSQPLFYVDPHLATTTDELFARMSTSFSRRRFS